MLIKCRDNFNLLYFISKYKFKLMLVYCKGNVNDLIIFLWKKSKHGWKT